MIKLRPCASQALRELFDHHPGVAWAEGGPTTGYVEWDQDGWRRRLVFEGSPAEAGGLVELADNNPLVCAEVVTVPTALTTLALVAIGPLARAGLVAEQPVLVASFNAESPDLDREMDAIGLTEPPLVRVDEQDFGSVLAVTALVEVATLADMGEIDRLFAESYSHCFFVRESDQWDTEIVSGKPWASYRLRMTPDDPNTLLTIQAMADRDGKCGAAQVVHTFNVMCGFEEQTAIA